MNSPRAASSQTSGRFLDAGCGSLLFTAPAYLETERKIVAVDVSLKMLHRARRRLINLAGAMPKNILLLQADVFDLPFRARIFQTILSMVMLHLFDNPALLVGELR